MSKENQNPNPVPVNHPDNLGMSPDQRSAEVDQLEQLLIGGDSSDVASSTSYDHLGRGDNSSNNPNIVSTSVEKSEYKPFIPGANIVYNGLARFRGYRAEKYISKKLDSSDPENR